MASRALAPAHLGWDPHRGWELESVCTTSQRDEFPSGLSRAGPALWRCHRAMSSSPYMWWPVGNLPSLGLSSAQLRLPFKASEMCNEQPFQSGTTCLCRMYRMSFSSATTWLGPACQEIQARPAFFSLIHSASVAGRYCSAWWSFAICVLDTLGPVLLSVRLCRTLQDKPTLAEGAQRGH